VIESIGYTDDGIVWMKILFEHEKQQGSMVIGLSQDKAKEISKILLSAATEAGEKCSVRNSANTH
jgi:hypothetical protein